MTTESGHLDIRRSLRGERIFITGATGFLGKVLVEKLLWSVPEIGGLVLLVRGDEERSAADRWRQELLHSPVFARLRALHWADWPAWATTKLAVVEGDLGRDRFGLEPESFAELATRIDRVVACAATVTFDERLDRAVELNARGALRPLELARAAGASLLHVSTCFVNGRREGVIAEKLAALGSSPEGRDPASILDSLDQACEAAGGEAAAGPAQVAAGEEQAARLGFHDAYTLTKALGERLLQRDMGEVPVTILRPAIVESALEEPIPGWIDAVRVADPLLVAYGRGRTREFAGSPDSTLEIIPVDFVVNAMIAALAELPGAERSSGEGVARVDRELPIYQVGSSRNPITLGELVDDARRGFTASPMRDGDGAPISPGEPTFADPDTYGRRLSERLERAESQAEGGGSTRKGRHHPATARTLAHFQRLFQVYSPYADHPARYDDARTQALWARLSESDRRDFPFDVAAIDWRAYVADIHVPGLQRFALKADNGAPAPRADDPVAAAHARGEFPAAGASTLFELLAIAAAADPETIAFQTCREGRWLRYSYGQALTTTTNLAARLAQHFGVQRGDRIVLWSSASPEWMLTAFAAFRLGATIVPLDPQWPADEVLTAARLTEAKLICAAPGLISRLEAAEVPVVSLAAPFVPEPDVALLPGVEEVECAAEPGDLASILFTSGTTVAPKAVPLTHDNFLSNVRDLVPIMRSSRQRLLSVLPIHHVFEFMVGQLVPLVGSGTISYVAEIKPAEISWMMNATRPTMLVAVPRLLELLYGGIRASIAAGGPALGLLFRVLFALSKLTGGRYGHRLFGKVHARFGGSLRRIATGGSALEPGLGRTFGLMGFEVAEGYGMTETSPVLTVNPWGEIRFGTVGRPLPGVEVETRPWADAAADAPAGSGEIWVRGGNVMAGYFRNPEATAATMDGGWLNTGDVGFFDDEGYLRISGRTKEVIVTGAGKNVYPEEVELRYRDLPGVQELVVLGLPESRGEGRGGEVVAAVVVPTPDGDEAAVKAAVTARSAEVPSYQRIGRLEIWRGDLPKTTTMKVQRARLREALLAGERGAAEAPAASTAPPPEQAKRGAEEAWVVETLARLAGARADAIRDSDRLEELGVDSLTRVEVVAAVEEHFGHRLDDESAAAMSRVRDLLDLATGRGRGAA